MNREELLKQAKPILFNTEMVKAILDGRKTQARRVVPERVLDEYDEYDEWCNNVMPRDIPCTREFKKEFFMKRARYEKGDILYVRETWSPLYPDEFSNHICGYMYKADNFNADEYDKRYPNGKAWTWSGKWKPSIHMPKEAARIFLKVTNVRVERLQNMTLQDVLNEGVKLSLKGTVEAGKDGAIQPFQKLWDSTVKKVYRDIYGWDANPYVWVIEFERVTE